MGVRLLIFTNFSTQHALIPYHTFIDFKANIHPIRLFYTIQVFLGCTNILVNNELSKIWQICCKTMLFSYTKSSHNLTVVVNYFKSLSMSHDNGHFPLFYKNSALKRKFPPNTIIPSHMLINFQDFLHPIRLFHTVRLFFWR